MTPPRDKMLERDGWQFILNISAVIFVGLAVVLGLSLLLFPPSSALFLGTAIAAGVCAAISLTCVGLARREKAKANQLRGRGYDRQSADAGGGEATRSAGMRGLTRDGPDGGAPLSSAAGKNESKPSTSVRSAGPGGGGGGGGRLRKN